MARARPLSMMTEGGKGGLWSTLDAPAPLPLLYISDPAGLARLADTIVPNSPKLKATAALALMQLWHVLAVACVAADLDVRPAGTLSTASRKRLGGKTRAAIGLGVGFAVVPRRAQEMYSQYKPRTAEAWRKRMIQRRAVVPLNERAPSILAVAFTCSVLMVRPHTLEFECCAPNSSHWRASNRR